jgi:hypothetical protein
MKLHDDDVTRPGWPPRPNLRLARRAPRDLAAIHSVVHRLRCTLVECRAFPNEWCHHPRQGHHLERYYVAHEGGLISSEELRAVVELSKPRENSYALIPVD